MQWPHTQFDEDERCWWTPLSCGGCGGYRHDLALTDPQAGMAALLLAQAAADAHAESGCLGCQSERLRKQVADPGHCLLWWDVRVREWMLWRPVDGFTDGLTFPTGVRWPASEREAEVAARLLMGDNPVPLRVVEDGNAGDPASFHVARRRDGTYRLWLACDACGGVGVSLHGGSLTEAASQALECLALTVADGCPQCITRAARCEDVARTPVRLWFDTELGDWVGRYSDSDGMSMAFALGFGRYDTAEADLHAAMRRLAADFIGDDR